MKLLMLSLALSSALLAQDPFQVKVTGHGQPMILIPGLSSGAETWDATVAHYKDRYECHVLGLAGFAGVPRVPGPFLERVRESLAGYIRKNHLDHPVIVGHSLGGYLALDLAAKYPDLPGKLVIVDSYPFLAGVMGTDVTPDKAKETAEQTRGYMSAMSQDSYERYVKSGLSTRAMVTKDSDLDRLIAWGLASDRTAVTDALVELMTGDLRDDIAKIKSPTLVMATWIAYKEYVDRAKIEANLHLQYAKLSGVDLQVTDTARHFIMWDDPNWMFAHMDEFLGAAKKVSAR